MNSYLKQQLEYEDLHLPTIEKVNPLQQDTLYNRRKNSLENTVGILIVSLTEI
ncbi:hypothetical protein [Bacillus cereus]|uniref:hypothetical protein n=1 Tax=Bacillus cereus TaxID=1396 RepID=UPI0015970C46